MFNCRRSKNPLSPTRFHPYLRGERGGRGIPLTKQSLHLLALAMNAEGAPRPG